MTAVTSARTKFCAVIEIPIAVQAMALAALIVVGGSAEATTWVVEPGAPGVLGRAVGKAADGDTLLLAPGEYTGSEMVLDHGIVMIGTGGAANTTIRSTAGRVLSGSGGDLSLDGLTLTGGRTQEDGGAIWWHRGSVSVVDCEFADNRAERLLFSEGGSVYVHATESVTFDHCGFRDSRTGGSGGHIFGSGGTLILHDCRLILDDDGVLNASAVYFWGSRFEMLDTEVRSVVDVAESLSICAGDVRIVGSAFLDELGYGAAGMNLHNGCIVLGSNSITFEENTVIGNPGFGSISRIFMEIWDGELLFNRNTCVGVSVAFSPCPGTLTAVGNVVQGGFVWGCGDEGEVACNCLDIEELPDDDRLDVHDNVVGPVEFCDRENGDLRVAEGSPCAMGNRPEVCTGPMGAAGEGCVPEPVLEGSWGDLKARFGGR